jgi:hypothetical protein
MMGKKNTGGEIRLSEICSSSQLVADPTVSPESIAKREKCSVQKVTMTISLAFLAPDLVKAAIEGRLPHGVGVTGLADLPASPKASARSSDGGEGAAG